MQSWKLRKKQKRQSKSYQVRWNPTFESTFIFGRLSVKFKITRCQQIFKKSSKTWAMAVWLIFAKLIWSRRSTFRPKKREKTLLRLNQHKKFIYILLSLFSTEKKKIKMLCYTNIINKCNIICQNSQQKKEKKREHSFPVSLWKIKVHLLT